jgi:excisionase family DNA binding protein
MNERLLTAPKLAVSPEEAAAMLSMSRDHFDRHVRDDLRVVRAGRRVLVPVRELERWVEQNAARSLEGDRT